MLAAAAFSGVHRGIYAGIAVCCKPRSLLLETISKRMAHHDPVVRVRSSHLFVLRIPPRVQLGHGLLQPPVAAGLAAHGGTDKHEAVTHDGCLVQLDHLEREWGNRVNSKFKFKFMLLQLRAPPPPHLVPEGGHHLDAHLHARLG